MPDWDQRRFWALVSTGCALLVAGLLPMTAGAQPPRSARDVASLRNAMLAAHNAERAARGVPPLLWSEDLAAEAALSAARLAAERDPVAAHGKRPGDGAGKPRGENLWVGTRGAYSFSAMAGSWLEERDQYVDDVMPNISSSGNWLDVGHYSQMIWRTTAQVGCALVSDARRDFLVCRYDPPGNIAGRNALTGARRP